DHYAEQLRLRSRPLTKLIESLVPEQPEAPQAEEFNPADPTDSVDVPPDEPDVDDSVRRIDGDDATEGNSPDTARPSAGDPTPSHSDEQSAERNDDAAGLSENVAGESERTDASPELVANTGNDDSSTKCGDDPVGASVSQEAENVESVDTEEELDAQLDQATKGDFASGRLFKQSRNTQAPKSRRTWRQLIMAQFDPGMALSLAATLAATVSQILSNSLLILLTVVFILLEASTVPQKLTAAFGAENRPDIKYQEIVENVQSYIVLKTVVSIGTGLLIAVWLRLFGVPYAGLWGMLAFLLNYIPNIGSIIAAVPALAVAWLDLGLSPCIACGIGYVLVNVFVGNFIEPRLMGRGMGLSPLVIFCSMLYWGWTLGPVGMLLSVPLTMGLRVGLEAFKDTKWIGVLLGNADSE
ncbi:MAG: AI-2E family transporter, partial [Planctomycetaceae bacterium]|nr:AI-2E family transporter [Planctomycetaceae bacterium]